jgi:hypothetical protein
MDNTKEKYVPTLEEIRQGCLEVQKKWTDDEFFKRANIRKPEYKVPVCEVDSSLSEHSAEKNIY